MSGRATNTQTAAFPHKRLKPFLLLLRTYVSAVTLFTVNITDIRGKKRDSKTCPNREISEKCYRKN
jgi:hypothetical protein